MAARLESIAEPGGITLSGKFHDEVCRKLDMSFVSTGEKVMKNITNPIPTFKIEVSSLPKAEDTPKTEEFVENLILIQIQKLMISMSAILQQLQFSLFQTLAVILNRNILLTGLQKTLSQ